MKLLRRILPILALTAPLFAATFGTVVAPAGGAAYSDIVLDQARGRLYLVASTINQVSVYSLAQQSARVGSPSLDPDDAESAHRGQGAV